MLAPQAAPARPKTQKVRVVRAFQGQAGATYQVDDEPTLNYLFALEMKNANKVVFLVEPPVAAAPAPKTEPEAPAETASTAAEKPGATKSGRKGGKDAP